MDKKRHKLLERQLKNLLPVISELPKAAVLALEHFFNEVNEAYRSYEEDRELLEHSMEISSEELYSANKDMREKNINLQKMQEETKALSIQFQAVFDNAAVGILAVDKDRKYVLANKAIQKMLGYSFDELHNLDLDIITHPEDVEAGIVKYNSTNKGDSYSTLKRYMKKDGSIMWARLTATKLADNDKHLAGVGIVEDITAQREAEETIREQAIQIQNAAIESAHRAGMSEVATGILHNVGNILNSINVGLETILRKFDKSVTQNLHKANGLLVQNRHRLSDFFSTDPKGDKLIDFYLELGSAVEDELSEQKQEATDLMKKLQLIKDVINTQQTYAKGNGEFKEKVALTEIVENALAMQSTSLARHEIEIVRKFSDAPLILAQRTKLIHVILNLIKNGKEAMGSGRAKEKTLTLEIGKVDSGGAFLRVSDTGEGIYPENLSKIFNHGFTTKQTGHGFGLHFCANSMGEMGGKIIVTSEGRGLGAQFTLIFDETELIGKAA